MKKILGVVLSAFMLCSSFPTAAQTDIVCVNVNGAPMTFDTAPVMENDRVLVPMRSIFEALGCEVTYFDRGENSVAVAKRGSDMMLLLLGENTACFNGTEISLDVPAKLINDRTYVPVRAISESFGTRVEWQEDTNTVAIFSEGVKDASKPNGGNFTNEMKMDITYDYNDYGANAVDRKGDHEDSPYFSNVDFYHAKSTDSLSILPEFKTIQQTSWWSCGVSCVEMVLNYYGKLGEWNEKTLADLREDHSDIHMGTCLDQIIEMFDKVGGFELETTYDYRDNPDAINMAFIKQHIKDGIPVIIGWNDWGGHWQVVIGYDDMGTEYEGDDVIIVADSFDTTDHNQDGYGVYGAERFIYNFTFYDFFHDEGHLKDKCFVAAALK